MKCVAVSYKKGAGTAYAELRVLRLITNYDELGGWSDGFSSIKYAVSN